MCFRAVDKTQKVVSFEFGLDEENPDEAALATGDKIDPLANSLRDLGKQMDLVYRNIHFY